MKLTIVGGGSTYTPELMDGFARLREILPIEEVWLVDPDDWMLPGVDAIASRIEQQLTPRAVVLVHDGGGDRRQTVAALKKLIPKLLGQGWTFDLPQVTISAHPLSGAHSPTSAPPPPCRLR